MATNTAIVEAVKTIVGGEFGELKSMLTDISDRVRGLEMREAGCSPLMNARVGALERQLTEHDGRLNALETAIQEKAKAADFDEHEATQATDMKTITAAITELKLTNKILTWLGGLTATSLVLWLIDRVLNSAFGG